MSRLLTITALLLLSCHTHGQPRPFSYLPDGTAFVSINGSHRYTRALYGGPTDYRLETSDRPIFATYKKTGCRNIRFTLITHDDGHTLATALDSTDHCEARYVDGRRDYIVRHTPWRDGQLTMSSLALHHIEGAVWQLAVSGFRSPPALQAVVSPVRATMLHRNGDLGVDAPDSFEPAAGALADTLTWLLEPTDSLCLMLTADGTAEPRLTVCHAAVYAAARAHLDSLAHRLTFTTPDPFVNTLGSALTMAADGCWDGQTWLHGCVGWRTPLPGWRAAYVGDVLGWADRAVSHFDAYAASQVTDVPPVVPHPAQDTLLARAAKRWGTPMYSNGYICRDPASTRRMHHYDMNLCYVDELLWHLCYDADTAYMRRVWPVLQRHADWERRNFDPDGDGLYDAYCCIWASDALYYSGGAVTHATAYNYRCRRLMADIARLIGHDPAPHDAEARKILSAMNDRLWVPAGHRPAHWAEYIEAMGYRRRHDAAALWSVYTPIDCGAATDAQCLAATHYVDSCLPHITIEIDTLRLPHATTVPPLPGPLATLSTTNWMPYAWSINNVAPAEVFHTALAYYQAYRPDAAYRLLLATILDQMYLGSSPANFGQLSYYDAARGECYRDFGDCIGIAARTLVQGLFGIVPDALHGRCILRPGFPAEWRSAAVTTPYLSYTYRRDGDNDVYDIEQHFAQPLTIVLRQNSGPGQCRELTGTDAQHQTITVPHTPRAADTMPRLTPATPADLSHATPAAVPACTPADEHAAAPAAAPAPCRTINIDTLLNADVPDIFRNSYLSPRPSTTTLQLPVHGVGEWCHPDYRPLIDDSGLRSLVHHDSLVLAGVPFRSHSHGHNIAYTSLFDNYPDSLVLHTDITGAHSLHLLLAGTTNHMQSRIDNAIVVAAYDDGTADTLRLVNPDNWCPIEQDYYDDGRAFTLACRPLRVALATGDVSRHLADDLGMTTPANRELPGGAAQILTMALTAGRRLTTLTIRPLSPDIIVGLMAVTAQ